MNEKMTLKKIIEKILKNKIAYCVVVILALIVLVLLMIEGFQKNKKDENHNETQKNMVAQSVFGINPEVTKRVGDYFGRIHLKKVGDKYIIDSTYVPIIKEDEVEKIDNKPIKGGNVPPMQYYIKYNDAKYISYYLDFYIDKQDVYTRMILNLDKENKNKDDKITLILKTGDDQQEFVYKIEDFQEINEEKLENLDPAVCQNKIQELMQKRNELLEQRKLADKENAKIIDFRLSEIEREIRNLNDGIRLIMAIHGELVL